VTILVPEERARLGRVDADGVAEVVYADECFLRVYAGTTGETRFIVPNANGTAYQYPTIADVDGDGETEIAVSSWGTFGGGDARLRDADRRALAAGRRACGAMRLARPAGESRGRLGARGPRAGPRRVRGGQQRRVDPERGV
jgi:hypothetical protein